MRKLRLSNEDVSKYVEDFQKMLEKSSAVIGGKIKMEFSVGSIKNPPKEEKAKVVFTPKAWLKTIELVSEFSSEVAWHYLVRRDEADRRKFILYDVLVYPQTVTSATVDMDEQSYLIWQTGLDDEVFNHIRGQGHSHVNMGVSPSGTDTDHQEKIVSQLTVDSENPFYVFIIINKSHKIHFDVYDVENNIVYEDGDISYYIYDEDYDLIAFIDDSKEMVQKPKPVVKQATQTVVKNVKNPPAKCSDVFDRDEKWNRFYESLYDSNYLL